jgi:DNA/RNA-binding domain of Phe-tRNA-synthetase-like protein
MKFIIDSAVFDKLPSYCVGTVTARGIDNSAARPQIEKLLDESIKLAESRFLDRRVKEEPDVVPYREAFQALGMNPNKYMCSIEALFTRIAKAKGMPHINPLVDLNNAVSLKYTLPMGTHDLGGANGDMEIRFSRPGDTFLPFGAEAEESPDPGELVYAVGSQVRTRRWTWRQSEHGKIDEKTDYVFFPIDGFAGFNEDRVRAAAAELEAELKTFFGCRTVTGFADSAHPEVDITL